MGKFFEVVRNATNVLGDSNIKWYSEQMKSQKNSTELWFLNLIFTSELFEFQFTIKYSSYIKTCLMQEEHLLNLFYLFKTIKGETRNCQQWPWLYLSHIL